MKREKLLDKSRDTPLLKKGLKDEFTVFPSMSGAQNEHYVFLAVIIPPVQERKKERKKIFPSFLLSFTVAWKRKTTLLETNLQLHFHIS